MNIPAVRRRRSGTRSRSLDRFLRNRVAVVALAFVVALGVIALLAPWLTPKDPNLQDLHHVLEPPSGRFLLGSDRFGRDTLSRLIVATRVTLVAAFEGLGLALLIGLPLGLLAGFVGRAADAVISRAADALLALPPLILALGIVGMLGPGLTNAMIALGIVLAPRFYRVTRGAAQTVRSETYIEAAVADGCSTWRTLWRHVLPNASGPILVQATLGIGVIIGAEAGLSFLGLGVQPPQASWGSMIRDGFDVVHRSTFSLLPPTVAVILTLVACFLVGDALRDAFGRGARAE